jgi:hypothetical protein
LYDEIEEIETVLEPLRDVQADLLRTQAAEHKKRIESLGEGEVSSFRLSLLQRGVSKLKARAEALANNSLVMGASLLRNEMDQIERILQPLNSEEAGALQAVKEATKKKLESVSKKDLPALQQEIKTLKEQAEVLATRSFLLGEIQRIEKTLGSLKSNRFKRAEASSLQEEQEDKKNAVRSAGVGGLASLRKDIRDLKERTEELANREGWFARIGQASALVWLAIIPLIVAIYAITIAIWQWREKPRIEAFRLETATAQTATAQAMPTATGIFLPTSTPNP